MRMLRCTESADLPRASTHFLQDLRRDRKRNKETMGAFIPLLGLTFLSLAAAGPSLENGKLHEQMTAQEVRQLFNAEPHEVPQYHVVPISWPKLHKRSHGSKTRLTVDAFGSNVKLWLNPVEGVLITEKTPVYFAQSADDADSAPSFVEIANAMSIVKTLFEDQEKQASLLVKSSASGAKLITGHIGALGWAVRPVPERFRRELDAKHRRSADNTSSLPNLNFAPAHHVIIKIPAPLEEADYLSQPLRDNILNDRVARSKSTAPPDIIYPEIMIFADYATFQIYNEYIYDLLEYLVAFWNGVDLRYRNLEKPKVRLNIAGIVVARDAKAFDFITKSKVSADTMNIFSALDALGRYLPTIKDKFPLSTYDLAVAMSPYAMCSPDAEDKCTVATLGLAYLAGACSARDVAYSKTLSVAVIQDKGGYDGIHSAAHEIGHLFGSDHDGSPDSICTYQEGHIMAASPVLNANSSDWSKCTIEAFDKFFNHDNPKCLYNKPKSKSPLPRILPGQYMTWDQQCQKLEGTSKCPFQADNPCLRLRCIQNSNRQYCTDLEDAPGDGTICGENKICVHARCVSI